MEIASSAGRTAFFTLMCLSFDFGFTGKLSAQPNVPRAPAVVELYT
jgi:hypothetical protein